MAPAIPFIMIAATVASTAMGAMGAIAQGNAQQAAYKYNADLAMQQGQAEAAKQEQENRRKIAEARAAYGAAGVDEQGTPLEVMQDLATQGELDRQTILYNAKMQAQGDVWEGKQAAQAGKQQAFGTILTGLGSAAGQGFTAFGGGSKPGTGLGMASTYTYPSATPTAHY